MKTKLVVLLIAGSLGGAVLAYLYWNHREAKNEETFRTSFRQSYLVSCQDAAHGQKAACECTVEVLLARYKTEELKNFTEQMKLDLRDTIVPDCIKKHEVAMPGRTSSPFAPNSSFPSARRNPGAEPDARREVR